MGSIVAQLNYTGAGSTNASTLGNYAKRIGRIYLHTTFGSGAEEFMSSMNKSLFDPKAPWYNPYKNSNWKNFGQKMKDAVHLVERNEEIIRNKNNGSYLKMLWHQLSSIPKLFKDEWIAGGKAAKTANKSVFWGKLGGAGKAFMKRFPLIGGIMMIGSQLSNIKQAFTHPEGGTGTGVVEIGKVFAKTGLDMAGFAVGQALIPIPFIGGLIGSMVVSGITSAILPSFSEKKGLTNQPKGGASASTAGNNSIAFGSGQNTGGFQPWIPPTSSLSELELAKLGMQLQNSAIVC